MTFEENINKQLENKSNLTKMINDILESRERQIEELEQENKELKEQIIVLERKSQ